MIAVRILAILLGVMMFVVGVTALLDSLYIVAAYIPILVRRHPTGRSKVEAAMMPAYTLLPTLIGLGGLWLIRWGWTG
jgi:hypothetical protein